jgi:hypothetical protein
MGNSAQFMAAIATAWLDGEICRRQGKDQPASVRADRLHAEYVQEERADLRGIRGGRSHCIPVITQQS